MTEHAKPQELPIEEVYTNEWNPNEQKDEIFNKLVENIQEIGMVEPIMVGLKPKEDDPQKKYIVISGAHRLEACKVLGYETIPAYVKEDFDEDMEKFQTVRMNVLKGAMNPVKFTELFNELEEKYTEDIVKDMMGFVDEVAFENVYMDVKENLPSDMQKEMDESKDEIQDVDDLSKILNKMFSKHGDTLDQNFMVFTYGGKTHHWIKMDKELKDRMSEIEDYCSSNDIDINEELKKVVLKWEGVADE
jgi:hypothetical protein